MLSDKILTVQADAPRLSTELVTVLCMVNESISAAEFPTIAQPSPHRCNPSSQCPCISKINWATNRQLQIMHRNERSSPNAPKSSPSLSFSISKCLCRPLMIISPLLPAGEHRLVKVLGEVPPIRISHGPRAVPPCGKPPRKQIQHLEVVIVQCRADSSNDRRLPWYSFKEEPNGLPGSSNPWHTIWTNRGGVLARQ